MGYVDASKHTVLGTSISTHNMGEKWCYTWETFLLSTKWPCWALLSIWFVCLCSSSVCLFNRFVYSIITRLFFQRGQQNRKFRTDFIAIRFGGTRRNGQKLLDKRWKAGRFFEYVHGYRWADCLTRTQHLTFQLKHSAIEIRSKLHFNSRFSTFSLLAVCLQAPLITSTHFNSYLLHHMGVPDIK